MSGFLSKLSTSDAPYPTPFSVKWIEVISPRTIGCAIHWKVSPSIELIPTVPVTVTVIGG